MSVENFDGLTDDRISCIAKITEGPIITYGFRDNTATPPRFASVTLTNSPAAQLERWAIASGPLTQWQYDSVINVGALGLQVALEVEGLDDGFTQIEVSRFGNGYPMPTDQLAVSLAQIVLAQPTVWQ